MQNCLDSAIKLLENTSKLIDVFRDARPINELDNRRLYKLKSIHNFFKSWEEATTPVNLMSKETRQDLDSVLLSFINLNEEKIHRIGSGLVPSRFNSDVVENVFCQQRGIYHGNKTNPTYADYAHGTNSLIIGQTLLSKRRNGNCDTIHNPLIFRQTYH